MNALQLLEEDNAFFFAPEFRTERQSVGSESNPQETDHQRIRLLLVEDSSVDANLVQLALMQVVGVSFDVIIATTIACAADHVSRNDIHVVLLDLGLPDSSGLDTLHRMREHMAAIPFIVLTGNEDDEIGVEAIRQGAQDFLVKGAGATSLTRAIRYAISRHRMRRKLILAFEAAKVSENNLRMIIENNLDGIIVVNREGLVVHANDAAEALFSVPSESIIGHPSPVTRIAESEPLMNLVNCQNRLVPTELRFNSIEWDGHPATLILLRDLTEHRKVESNRHKLELAREVQQELRPKAQPMVEGLDIAGLSETADETGGDYFDFVPMSDNVVGLVVADASGHGIGSALLISVVSAYVRAFGSMTSDPGDVLRRVAKMLSQRICEGQFVTAVLACIDPVRRTLTYASAGHPSALWIDAAGNVRADLTSLDFPIGLDPDHKFQSSSVSHLQSGDVLILISDGILEAMRRDGILYGKQRVIQQVVLNMERPARMIAEELIKSVKSHCAPDAPADDLTVIVAKVT